VLHLGIEVKRFMPLAVDTYQLRKDKTIQQMKIKCCLNAIRHFLFSDGLLKPFVYIFQGLFLLILIGCDVDKPDEIVKLEKNLPDVIDYNFHVKPILSDKCFACHGPDMASQKGDLRLDTEEGAYKAVADGGSAIVPGELKNSLAFMRMISEDPEIKMPPPESHLQLTNLEIATLAKWIEQGAEYKPHWSFIPPVKSEPPKVKNNSKIKQPIDNFTEKRLEREGLSLSEIASKETLIRRASFDVTGLPPTITEIDDFLKDDSSNAYEKLVDRLLGSEAYGERMAADWMDVARYADSDGYLDDKHRDFSPWRDWVIKAFNENMPYDQFAIWQLAGDLVPESNQETKLATAFNRLNKKNSEAGIVYEEYRVEYAADRTHTLGKAFMGLSIECARCHDHKYDPISQKDYYKLFGFFNSTFEIGTPVYGPDQTPGPALLLTSEEQQEQLDFLHKTIAEQEAKVETAKINDEGFEQWLEKISFSSNELNNRISEDLVAYYPFDHFKLKDNNAESPNKLDSSKPAKLSQPNIKPGKDGKAFFVTDYNLARLGEKVGWYERTDPFSFQLWVYPDTVYKEAAVMWHSEDRRLGLKGYSLTLRDNKLEFIMAHSWPQNAIQLTAKQALPVKEWSQVTVTYDGSSKADGVAIYVNGEPQSTSTDFDNLYKGILYEKNIHTYGFGGIRFGVRTKFVPFKNGGIDEVKVYKRKLTALEVLYSYDENSTLLLVKDQSSESKKMLYEYYISHYNPDYHDVAKKLKEIRDKENELVNGIQEIMVMGDLPEPRSTYVLNRGVYNAQGEQVEPGVPESVLPFGQSLPKNRLGLAKWLFDPANPLTARVFVNRIWQMYFGKGIVETSDDFGSQGSLPSHPELLDWLAIYFQENGWNVKDLHKLILTSATYMQNSLVTKELQEKDPENILLARGPRFRLPAEMIRDNALAISGLLVNKIGGKSVYPYQPAGIWDELSTKSWAYKYLQESGEGLYRRSLYTIWKRTAPPPSMLIFDIADRGVCTVRRKPTSTPLQALVLLNDPQFIEAGRVVAEHLIQHENDTTKRLNMAFRLATGRFPDDTEKNILNEFYKEELKKFDKNKEDALAFLSIGESRWDEKLNPSEIAALGVVVNSVMNTNDAFTKN